jgi:hypothetical protein
MKFRAVFKSASILLAICFAALAFLYLCVAEVWTINLKIDKRWVCDGVATGIASPVFYFPDRGGASGPDQIDSILKKCPEINFDQERETLFISEGRELQSFSIKPLYRWRLDKSWTYGYPRLKEANNEGLLHVYAIDRTDIGFPL